MSRTRTRTKLSYYQGIPFFAIKAVSLVSASIVTGILVYFSLQLKSDGFKIPWTFLIMAVPAVINLLVLVITTLLHCCGRPSPLFNLIMNIPLVLLWILGLTLLSWNLAGTLSHSCTISNWGSNDGIRVCNTYKALYAFILFAILSQLAQIVLDIRAKREQSRLGKYNKMEDPADIKMDPVRGFGQSNGSDQPFLQEQARDESPGRRPGATSSTTLVGSTRSPFEDPVSTYHPAAHAQFDANTKPYADSQQSIHMDDFGFDARPQYTAYNTGTSYHDDVNRRY